jgi:hypothetical protein
VQEQMLAAINIKAQAQILPCLVNLIFFIVTMKSLPENRQVSG